LRTYFGSQKIINFFVPQRSGERNFMNSKKQQQNLGDLLVTKLKALLDIETQITKALPKMAKNANDPELKKGFEKHLKQTQGHVKRLKQAFKLLGMKAQKITVDAIRGLIKDGEWVIKNVKGPEALDANLIAAAQYVEHYEMAGYGSAATWANELGYTEIADLLNQTLEEEKQTDEELTSLAESRVNEKAMAI